MSVIRSFVIAVEYMQSFWFNWKAITSSPLSFSTVIVQVLVSSICWIGLFHHSVHNAFFYASSWLLFASKCCSILINYIPCTCAWRRDDLTTWRVKHVGWRTNESSLFTLQFYQKMYCSITVSQWYMFPRGSRFPAHISLGIRVSPRTYH